MILSDEQFALIAARDAEIDHLRARCDELNEACSAKQALLDHVAAENEQLIGIMEKSGDPMTQFAASMCRGKPAKLSIRGDVATFTDMT